MDQVCRDVEPISTEENLMTAHTILGETVTMPVEIRAARACSALFTVHEKPARRLLAEAGLLPVRPLPGRAICALAFVRYVDGDLGPYHEFAVALLCRQPGRRGTIGAYIHWLPVNQSFTCEAGRSIWGFPKENVDIDVSFAGSTKRCVVAPNGRTAVDMRISRGAPVPSGTGATSIDAYTWRDGILRRTPWNMDTAGVRTRPGGARVELGDHPVADQLRELGLPRSAMLTTEISTLGMTFNDAEQVRR